MGFAALALFFAQYACAGSGAKSSSYNALTSDDFDGNYYEAAEEEAYYGDDYEYEYPREEKSGGGGMYSENDTDKDDDPNSDPVEPATLDEKLVYTCTMDMETTEYEETIAAIRALIDKYNGIIGYETYSDSAQNWYYSSYEKRSGTLTAYLVIRIPSKNYRAFLEGMEGHGKITRSEQSVENITRKYSETQTTIRSLETQEERLLEMMENAETIEEMLAIEDRLSEVQNELQIMKNRLAEMDTDITYSTVNLNVREVIEYTEDPESRHTLTFSDRLKNTLQDSWSMFTGFLEGLLFFLIRALPIMLVIGGITIGIMFIIMGIVKSSKKRNARKAAKNLPAAQADGTQTVSVPNTPEEQKK